MLYKEVPVFMGPGKIREKEENVKSSPPHETPLIEFRKRRTSSSWVNDLSNRTPFQGRSIAVEIDSGAGDHGN